MRAYTLIITPTSFITLIRPWGHKTRPCTNYIISIFMTSLTPHYRGRGGCGGGGYLTPAPGRRPFVRLSLCSAVPLIGLTLMTSLAPRPRPRGGGEASRLADSIVAPEPAFPYYFRHIILDNSLHYFAHYACQNNRSVIFWLTPISLLVNRNNVSISPVLWNFTRYPRFPHNIRQYLS